MKKPEKLLLSVLAVALLTVCFGHTSFAFAQNGGPTDASATVTLLEGIDSARSQPGHQYRAVLDKPISVSGISVPKGTAAIVVLTQARAGNAAIWTLQLTGFVVGGAPVAVNGTSPTLPRSFGNVLGAVNSAGRATAAGLRVFLQPEQVVTFALGTPMGGGSMTVQGAPQGSSPMVQEQSGIRLELTGCTKEGTRVDCEFFATNVTANDFNLGFCDGNGGNFHGSYLIDQLGNKLLNPAWTLGSTNGNSGNRQLMLPGVRTPLSLVFQPLDARAVSLLRLDLAYSNIPHQSCQNDFTFSGIPLPDHVVSTPPLSSGTDSSYSATPPETSNPSSSMQIRGQVGYSLQGCSHAGKLLVCTVGAMAQVSNPRHVTWDESKTYIVDASGNKFTVAQLHFGADPAVNAVFVANQTIPLTLTFLGADQVSSIARLELDGYDGTPFSVRWANVPVLVDQPEQAGSPAAGAVADEELSHTRPGDPAGFEVLNVRIGMNAQQTIDILQKRFGVLAVSEQQSLISTKPPKGPYVVYFPWNDGVYNYIKAVNFLDNSKGTNVSYNFVPTTPLHPSKNKETLNYIVYQEPLNTPADVEQFHQDVISHYGKPELVTDDKELKSLIYPAKYLKSTILGDIQSYSATLGVNEFQIHASPAHPVMVWCVPTKTKASIRPTVSNCSFPIMVLPDDKKLEIYDLTAYAGFLLDKQQMADDAKKKVTVPKSVF